MGLEKSEFPELEGMDYDDFEEDQAQSAEEREVDEFEYTIPLILS